MTDDELRREIQQQLQKGSDMITTGAEIVRHASDRLATLRCGVDVVDPIPEPPIPPEPAVRATKDRLTQLVRQPVTWISRPQDLTLQGGELTAVSHPTNEGSTHNQFKARLGGRSYRLRYTMELGLEFDFGGELESGKIGFGVGGGTSPTGRPPSGGSRSDDGFMFRMAHSNRKLMVYAYWKEHKQKFGKYILSDIDLIGGGVYDIDFTIQCNDPGVDNGWFLLGVNGQKALEVKQLDFMNGTPMISELIFNFFFGGSDKRWSPEGTQEVKFSNIHVEKLN